MNSATILNVPVPPGLEAADFYAVAYRDSSGNIVIHCRGTDYPAGDAVTGWASAGGFLTTQAELAARFY
jgi:hypothetical protein